MKYLALVSLVILAGCGGYHATVQGGSGKQYTAPDICAALVQCLNSTTETACYMSDTTYATSNGTIESTGCKQVTK